ncbi:hypothetical protein CLD22_15725 [Rubrivivax gelatinosus]|nr:hypothetical protein [Rubrivivax gelatinosus]
MDSPTFARRFGLLYREFYLRAPRRADDGRERPSPDTVAMLLHMAQAGPATASELARQLDRAQSTLNARVAALEAAGLVSRRCGGQDVRRTRIWLSPAGRQALAEALEVLDTARLEAAAAAWDDARRRRLIDEFDALLDALLEAVPPATQAPAGPPS